VIAETKIRSRENAVAREALRRNGVRDCGEFCAEARTITNQLAAEHLTVDAATIWSGSRMPDRCLWAAGAQPMGDYISDESHAAHRRMARVRGG